MNITTVRKAVRNPSAFSTAELHEALDVLVNDERFTEKQMTKGQHAIEIELLGRTLTSEPIKLSGVMATPEPAIEPVMLTSEELLYGLNRAIWAIQESGRFEDAEAMRAIRDRAFDFKAMGFND